MTTLSAEVTKTAVQKPLFKMSTEAPQSTSTPESDNNVEINPLPPPLEYSTASSSSFDPQPGAGHSISQEGITTTTTSPTLDDLSRDMFDKVAAYFHGELEAAAEDYAVLEKMNRVTTGKYVDMKTTGANIAKALNELNEKYAAITPQLHQIDQVEASVTQLEEAAQKLDLYSRELEKRWKQYEKPAPR